MAMTAWKPRTDSLSFERTPGPQIVVSRAIDAPPDVVWSLLTDTQRWPEWGPSIVGVERIGRASCRERV